MLVRLNKLAKLPACRRQMLDLMRKSNSVVGVSSIEKIILAGN